MITNHHTHQDKQIKMKTYSERIVVHLSANVFFRYGYTLTPTSVCHFNAFVLEEVYSLLFYGIDLECKLAPTTLIKESIERFCDANGFDEDIFSYERVKKAYFRFRKRRNTVTIEENK
jgi:hypothetical protein